MSGENHYFMQDNEPFFYINLGTHATPVMTEVANAEEIKIPLSKGKTERHPRLTQFTLKRGAGKEAPISFKYNRARVADAIYELLWDSYVNDTPVEFAMTDLPITDPAARGFRAWCEVFEFPLMGGSGKEGVAYDIGAEPTDYEEGGVLILPELLGAS